MSDDKPFLSLQTKITVLVCGVVALSLLVANILITRNIAEQVQYSIGENATDIARVVARSPVVIKALTGQADTSEVQMFAEEIRKATEVQYIVVMDRNGIRKSHPEIDRIGQRFVGGDEAAALIEGKEYTSVAKGTLGLGLRAFAPVFDSNGRQVGAVAVGVLIGNVEHSIAESRTIIYFATGLGLLVGMMGALALARNIKKTMFGLEPFAIAKLLEERSAMIQSVREGILAVDKNAAITVVNEEAARIFNLAGIKEDLIGKPVNEYVANSRLKDVMETGRVELDQEQDINGVVILTNRMPIRVNGKIVGAIATFRDKTEIRQLAEEVTGIRNYAETLRAQTHEFMNKLHVILGMVRMQCYDEIASYITGIAQQYQAEVGFIARRIKEPVLAGFLLGKLSRAREMGVELLFSKESYLPRPANSEVIHELITIVGNLIDNAMDAVEDSPEKEVEVYFDYLDGMLLIEVSDTGPGIPEDAREKIFQKGYSTKPGDRGLGLFLVHRSLEKLNGEIEIVSGIDEATQFRVCIPYESKGESE